MNEAQLIAYMESVGVSLFKITRYDMLVFRNIVSGKKGSISREKSYVPMSVVALCKSVRAKCPEHLKQHDGAYDNIVQQAKAIEPPNSPIIGQA